MSTRDAPVYLDGLRDNKFGVPYEDTLALYKAAASDRHLEVSASTAYRSQITPWRLCRRRRAHPRLVDALAQAGIDLHHIDSAADLAFDTAMKRRRLPPSWSARCSRVSTRAVMAPRS